MNDCGVLRIHYCGAVAAVISDEDYASYFTVYPKPGTQAGTWTLGYDFSEETTTGYWATARRRK